MSESGIVTRDELLAMGCEERKGRTGRSMFYSIGSELLARTCSKCNQLKTREGFNLHKKGVGGIKDICTECRTSKNTQEKNHKVAKHTQMYGGILKANKKQTVYEELNHTIVAKVCITCNVLKSTHDFHNDVNGLGKVSPRCKICTLAYMKTYYKENSHERIQYAKDYYYENRETLLQYWLNFRRHNPEKRREHYLKNRDHEIQRAKEWSRTPKGKESSRNSRKRRRTKIRDTQRKWAEGNPEKIILYRHRRYARKIILIDDFSKYEYFSTMENFRYRCALTGDSIIHLDHVIPLAIGHGGTTYGNMIPLSATLNKSKNASHIFEWFDANRERFNLSQRKFDELIEYLAQINEMTTQEYRAYVDWCFDNPRDINEMEATG